MRALLLVVLTALFSPPQDAEALLKSARERASRKDYVGSVIDFTRALALEPDHVDALVGRAMARRELQDLEGAMADAAAALKIDPRHVEAYGIRGNCRADRQDHAGAVADFTRAIELGADSPLVYAMRGFSLASAERYEAALADLDRAIAGGHRSPQAFASRAWARLARLDFRGAISDATRSLQRQPRTVRGHGLRALAYLGVGSWENALRDLRAKTEIAGSCSASDAIWMHLLRSRMGEKEAAGRELREFRTSAAKEPGAAWAEAVLDFMLGERSEEDLLKAAEGHTLDAHLFIGHRRVLEGREADAAGHFERAAGAEGTKVNFERLAARAEVERFRFQRRNAVLDELEGKFRALKPFRADFQGIGLSGGKEGRTIASFEMWYDRDRGRLQVDVRGTDRKGGEWEGHFSAEGAVLYAWGIEESATKIDGTAFFQGLEKWSQEVQGEMDRLVPRGGEPREAAATSEPHLIIDLSPRPSKEEDATWRMSIGRGGGPAGWLREARGSAGCVMKEKDDEVRFEMASGRKIVIVDRATGFLRSLRVLDPDGTPHEIRVASFRPIEAFPEVRRPEKFENALLDLAQLAGRWRDQVGWLQAVLAGALDRWEEVSRADRQKDLQAFVTRWAARYADTLRTYALKTLARAYVLRRLDQGTRLEDLARDEEAKRFAEACTGQASEIEGFLRARLEELAFEIETRAIEAPIDSRRHGALAELLKASFEFRTVEAERAKAYGDRTNEAFREELDSQKRL